jgi:hypothetical protein
MNAHVAAYYYHLATRSPRIDYAFWNLYLMYARGGTV